MNQNTDMAPLWREILSSSASANSPGSLEPKTLICLGDDSVGKEALINSMRKSGSEQGSRTALEYTYIDPFGPEDEGEQSPRLNIWKLNGCEHKHVLKFAINPRELSSTMALVVVDFSKPWALLTSLTQWMDVLEEQLLAAYDECPDTGLDTEHQQAQERWFKDYVEPAKDEAGYATKFTAAGGDDIDVPLGDGTLTKNLGLPIVIACNKSDLMPSLEKSFEYHDSDFEFIQQHLRKFALQYGATLVYTSTKTGKGTDIMADYIAHRLLGTPFSTRAQVLDKDTLFVPSGYDSLERITVLDDHTKQGRFEELIAPPINKVRTARSEDVVVAEEDQAFLERHKSDLDQASKGDRPVRTTPAVIHEVGPSPTAAAGTSPTGVAGVGTPNSSLAPGSSAMLQNFFESLMRSESNENLRKDVEDMVADEKRKHGT